MKDGHDETKKEWRMKKKLFIVHLRSYGPTAIAPRTHAIGFGEHWPCLGLSQTALQTVVPVHVESLWGWHRALPGLPMVSETHG